MGYLWSGNWPKNRSPLIKDFDIPFAFKYTKADKIHSVSVKYKDPDSDRLSYHWTIFEESNDRRIGGDKEEIPKELIECIIEQESNGTAEIKIPSKKVPTDYILPFVITTVVLLSIIGHFTLNNYLIIIVCKASAGISLHNLKSFIFL